VLVSKPWKSKKGHGIASHCFGQTVRVYNFYLVQTVRFQTMKDNAAAQATFLSY
jgi:hypothetical protein